MADGEGNRVYELLIFDAIYRRREDVVYTQYSLEIELYSTLQHHKKSYWFLTIKLDKRIPS